MIATDIKVCPESRTATATTLLTSLASAATLIAGTKGAASIDPLAALRADSRR